MVYNGLTESLFRSISRLELLLPNNISFKHHLLCCVEGAETMVLFPHPCSELLVQSFNSFYPESMYIGKGLRAYKLNLSESRTNLLHHQTWKQYLFEVKSYIALDRELNFDINRGALKFLFDKNNVNINKFIKDVYYSLVEGEIIYIYGKGAENIYSSLKKILESSIKLNSVCRKRPCYYFPYTCKIIITESIWYFQLNIFLISDS